MQVGRRCKCQTIHYPPNSRLVKHFAKNPEIFFPSGRRQPVTTATITPEPRAACSPDATSPTWSGRRGQRSFHINTIAWIRYPPFVAEIQGPVRLDSFPLFGGVS